MSAYSDTAASTGGLSVGGAPSEYYSGNESGEGVRPLRRPTRSASRVGGHSGDESDTEDEDSSEEDSSDDDDVLDDLDLEDDDIPVTGFAVASNKRNADFHELFPNVPEGDYLIEGELFSMCTSPSPAGSLLLIIIIIIRLWVCIAA
jgi:hypothetical protein